MTRARTSPATLSRSVDVQAPAERVWALVSDLPAMGELSPENAGGRWLNGAQGPTVGARFKGTNKRGWRRWSTAVTVTDCEPGRTFAFAVRSAGLPVATWAYAVEPQGDSSCRVTETWTDQRGRLITTLGTLATGVSDRQAFTATSIEQTLEQLRVAAEGQS